MMGTATAPCTPWSSDQPVLGTLLSLQDPTARPHTRVCPVPSSDAPLPAAWRVCQDGEDAETPKGLTLHESTVPLLTHPTEESALRRLPGGCGLEPLYGCVSGD